MKKPSVVYTIRVPGELDKEIKKRYGKDRRDFKIFLYEACQALGIPYSLNAKGRSKSDEPAR